MYHTEQLALWPPSKILWSCLAMTLLFLLRGSVTLVVPDSGTFERSLKCTERSHGAPNARDDSTVVWPDRSLNLAVTWLSTVLGFGRDVTCRSYWVSMRSRDVSSTTGSEKHYYCSNVMTYN